MTNPIIAHDLSITLVPQPSIRVLQAGLLHSADFFVWEKDFRDKAQPLTLNISMDPIHSEILSLREW